MDIDNDLIMQWEPKVQKMASNTYVNGIDRDDLVQELRFSIVKAAQGFEEDRGILFHTYLHTAMANTIRTLMTKAQRLPPTVSADATVEDGEMNMQSIEVIEALTDPTDFTVDVNFADIIRKCGFSDLEETFITLRLEGLTMGEISEDLGESSYKIRQGVKDKLMGRIYETET